jgi:hypothetical protein
MGVKRTTKASDIALREYPPTSRILDWAGRVFLCSGSSSSVGGLDIVLSAFTSRQKLNEILLLHVLEWEGDKFSGINEFKHHFKRGSNFSMEHPNIILLPPGLGGLNAILKHPRIDIFIEASRADVSGRQVMEAAASGVPVIAPSYMKKIFSNEYEHILYVKSQRKPCISWPCDQLRYIHGHKVDGQPTWNEMDSEDFNRSLDEINNHFEDFKRAAMYAKQNVAKIHEFKPSIVSERIKRLVQKL